MSSAIESEPVMFGVAPVMFGAICCSASPVWREMARQSGSAPAKLTQRWLALNDFAGRKVALGGASHVSRARNDPERAQNDEASILDSQQKIFGLAAF